MSERNSIQNECEEERDESTMHMTVSCNQSDVVSLSMHVTQLVLPRPQSSSASSRHPTPWITRLCSRPHLLSPSRLRPFKAQDEADTNTAYAGHTSAEVGWRSRPQEWNVCLQAALVILEMPHRILLHVLIFLQIPRTVGQLWYATSSQKPMRCPFTHRF